MEGEGEFKPWNSWENLILVCLVLRYGIEEGWETIAFELRSRVDQKRPGSSPPEFFTPQECMQRFQIIHKQFLASGETSDRNGGFEETVKAMKVKYTKIHTDTLERAVETYKKNIEFLEQKVERLKRAEEAEKVVVNADEDGEPSSMEIDGCDDQDQVVEVNDEFDQTGVRLCMAKMNKKMMDEVIEKLHRHRRSIILYHEINIQKGTDLYRKTIRQHMDLELIKSKIYKEKYTNSSQSFFRDLLLLYNNAIVFFEKGSQEHALALQLRRKVREEMKKVISVPVSEEDLVEDIEYGPVVNALPASSTTRAKPSRKPRKPKSVGASAFHKMDLRS